MINAGASTQALRLPSALTALGGGLAAGVGVVGVSRALLPSPKGALELEAVGVETMSDREAVTTIGPVALVAAAAIGTGLGKRAGSGPAALATATLGAAAMLTSTSGSAVANADGKSAPTYQHTLGLMAGVAVAGYGIGALDKVPEHRAKLIGLAVAGLAAGTLIPETMSYLGRLPGTVGRSVQHRDA